MIGALVIGALLIGAGFLLTDDGGPNSGLKEAQALAEEGTVLLQSYRFQDSLDPLETALELDPTLPEAAIGLATAYLRLGRREEFQKTLALADSLTAALPDEDRRMVAQLRLGLMRQSHFSSMVDSLMARLPEEQPNNIHVMRAQAELIKMEGTFEEKVAAWHRILDQNPNFAEAYNQLGYLELYYGDYDRAVEYMKKYAFLAPELANPHDSLGDVLMVRGEYEDAAREFRAAITKQPDFYDSYINLAKTMLFRGMIKDGVEIMDQVHEMVEGTTLGLKVDLELFNTYFELDMQKEVGQMSEALIVNYPEIDHVAVIRAIRYGYMGRMEESAALMDSTLGHWRSQELFHLVPAYQRSINITEKSYEAHIADIADSPATRVRKWEDVLRSSEPYAPIFQLWPMRINLARAYLDNGQPREGRAQIEPILAVNPRLVPALTVAVRTDLALRDPEGARMALEQLKWSIQQADEDYIGRRQAAELEDLVLELEGHS